MSLYYLLFYASWILSMVTAIYVYIGHGRTLGWFSPPVTLYGVGAFAAFVPFLDFFSIQISVFGLTIDSTWQHLNIARALCGIASIGLAWSVKRTLRLSLPFAWPLFTGGILGIALVFFWCFLAANGP